jgi:hypothetical protein
MGGEALHRRLHAAQHLRRHRLPDHLERAGHLVQLLARGAQLAGIHRGEIDPARMLGLAGEAAQGLGGGLHGLARSSSTQARAPDPGRDGQLGGRFGGVREHEGCAPEPWIQAGVPLVRAPGGRSAVRRS